MNQSFDDILESVLIELLVLTASAPLGTMQAFNQLCDGIAQELKPEAVERSIDYANYRIDQIPTTPNQ